MKLWARVFLGYFLVVGLTGWFVLRVFLSEVKPSVRESVEDVMVDSAHLLAELARDDLLANKLQDGRFARAVRHYGERTIHAPIWGREKQSLDFRVYVTDAAGVVRFDSENEAQGQDYSAWRDVSRTLRGEYGARSTRDDPDDPSSSVLYVAAPIFDGPRTIGVVTVAKPTAALEPIIHRSEKVVFRNGMLLLFAALLIGLLFTAWLTWSMNRLLTYARALGRGERMPPPSRARNEIGELARALATLREELDGRAYVERYVQHLTHEMKSPLAAIRGAAEVLTGPVTPADAAHFADSIVVQTKRLQRMIDEQLRLAQLEHQATLENPQPIALGDLFAELKREFDASAQLRNVQLDFTAAEAITVQADAFLLHQALANLLENALTFAPEDGHVRCTASSVAHGASGTVQIEIIDNGPGIPDYARERVFERFFSLPRPGDGRKGTGLGLSMVAAIARLHGGSVSLEPAAGGGTSARLTLPG